MNPVQKFLRVLFPAMVLLALMACASPNAHIWDNHRAGLNEKIYSGEDHI